MHFNWYMMTVTMPVCFTMCILLIITQIKSFKWYSITVDKAILKQQRELFCLYGIYVTGALCAIQCFLCHISNLFPQWYCIYGMPICVIIYAATKTFLYGFFLERAKCIHSDKSTTKKILPDVVTKYILPIYIAGYFCVYLILCPLAFRGAVIDPTMTENKSIPTACLFGKYESWVFWFGAAVDVFNSIFFLFLFTYPLYDAIKRKENFKSSIGHQLIRKEFIKTMKYNIICSSICSISSVSFLFIMSFAETGDIGHYLWFGGNIDIIINSICTFLMVGGNRRYIGYLLTLFGIKNQKEIDGVFGAKNNITPNMKQVHSNSNIAMSDFSSNGSSNGLPIAFHSKSSEKTKTSTKTIECTEQSQIESIEPQQQKQPQQQQQESTDADNSFVLTNDATKLDLKNKILKK